MAFMLAGMELVTVLAEKLVRRVAVAADIRILEPGTPCVPSHDPRTGIRGVGTASDWADQVAH